jgi:hypothetical protein
MLEPPPETKASFEDPMNRIAIEAKRDFLERLSSTSPIKAVAELIWNGLDAGAEEVVVHLETNGLESIEVIRVADNGGGIDREQIQALFGGLGDSWKKAKGRFKGRALHGKNGQGRFKAFALGNRVEWNSVYQTPSGRMRFQVLGKVEALTDLQYSDAKAANGDSLGTEVVVSGIDKSLGSLQTDNAREELAKLFAAYLSQYPDISIVYDGERVDPAELQVSKREIILDEIPLTNDRTVKATISIIEWQMPAKRIVHLCDADGVSLHETEMGQMVRAPGFEFTVYVKCDHFRELDKAGTLALDDLHPDVSAIVHSAKQAVKAHFRRRLSERQSQIVERWKKERIYPFETKDELNSVEEAERQVFDILAVNVESYLPAFEEADHKAKRFRTVPNRFNESSRRCST